jgi:hypothetical protein
VKAGCEGSTVCVVKVLELELFSTVHSVPRCGVRVATYGVMGSDSRGKKP